MGEQTRFRVVIPPTLKAFMGTDRYLQQVAAAWVKREQMGIVPLELRTNTRGKR